MNYIIYTLYLIFYVFIRCPVYDITPKKIVDFADRTVNKNKHTVALYLDEIIEYADKELNKMKRDPPYSTRLKQIAKTMNMTLELYLTKLYQARKSAIIEYDKRYPYNPKSKNFYQNIMYGTTIDDEKNN
ncbi:hypothetical protein A3Q56_08270 [Intoshia linei]|uniref:Uncharacterized protein n=1 Tax=Intoshia linei TaxID=1819745 RepID=A0A177APW8_9BILA|nr:hypothetical protein A3Q56_08270 [Intoshia linei]